MPRGPRLHAPNRLHHLIARFLNREFLLCGSDERQEYLRRVPGILERSDTRPLGYALMSNHTHWACGIGSAPVASFIKPLHGGFASWLNRHLGRLGPAFAGRFTDVLCPEERTAILLAYLHNNPVRAGLVRDPAECDWTSHPAYLGLVPAPPWLDVAAGLCASGFDASPAGRSHFHDFVVSRAIGGRDALLSGDDVREDRKRVRGLTGAPCEVTDAQMTGDLSQSQRMIVIVRDGAVRPRWPGDAVHVMRRVSLLCGIDPAELPSRNRRREVVAARRLSLWLWTRELGRAQREMNGVLGLSCSSGSELLRTRPAESAKAIAALGDEMWAPFREKPQA